MSDKRVQRCLPLSYVPFRIAPIHGSEDLMYFVAISEQDTQTVKTR